MALLFLLDEHLRDGPLWQAIQHHNARGAYRLDVDQVGDPPDLPRGTSDPDMLIWAEREARLVVSLDRNSLPGHLSVHLQTGRHSPGVLIIRSGTSIPLVLARLTLIAYAGNPADHADTVQYIP